MSKAQSIIANLAAATIDNSLSDRRHYTLHSHTEYCDGRAQMQAFVPAAIATGMTVYGFTPHCPIPITSPCNMTLDNVDAYRTEFMRLKEAYNNDITLLMAMEVDYLGNEWGPSHPYFETVGLDYRIGSVHFVKTRQQEAIDVDGRIDSFRIKMAKYFNNDIRYVVDRFYDTSLEMIDRGGFDIIGHFDKIGHNASQFSPGIEQEEWYQDHIERMIEAIASAGLTVEINTKAWREFGRMFPTPACWGRLIEGNIPIVVNSDAHVPALVDAGRIEAFEMIDRLINKESR